MSLSEQTAINWPQVLEDNRSWLIQVLRARVGHAHDVEDVYQDLVLAVLRQVHKTRGAGPSSGRPRKALVPTEIDKVAPWLYRLAVRHVVNFYRKTNRQTHAKAKADLEPTSPTPQPLDWMLNVERQQDLESALEELSPQEREVLMLKYAENWTYRQMADHLGVPVRNIEYRLLNARQRLRRALVRREVTSPSAQQ